MVVFAPARVFFFFPVTLFPPNGVSRSAARRKQERGGVEVVQHR